MRVFLPAFGFGLIVLSLLALAQALSGLQRGDLRAGGLFAALSGLLVYAAHAMRPSRQSARAEPKP